MSDFVVDLSAELEMTMGWVASNISVLLIYFVLDSKG